MSNTVDSSVASERWVETTLGELAEYITSGSRDWSKYYADSGAIFIRTQDINRNRLSLNEVAFVKLPEKVEGKRSLVRKGDLLVTITGANVGKVAVVEGEIPEAYVSQSVCLVRLKDPSLAKFVHLQLTAKRGDKTAVEAMAYGLGRPVLNLENIRSAPIRVAPSIAQVLIVAEIEKQFSRLDEAVANLKRVKANLKRYKAAVLKSAVEGKLTEDWRKQHPDVEPASSWISRTPVPPRPNRWNSRSRDVILGHPALAVGNPGLELPSGWTWAPLVDIARMESGHTPSREHPEWWEGDVPWIGIADAREHDGRVIMTTLQHTNEDGLANSAARLLPSGTVCVSRTASVGYVVVLGRPMATSQDFVNWIPTAAVSSDWLRVVFSADREALRRFGKGSVHKTIYFPEWLSVHIGVPPIAEQKQIVAEVERCLSGIEELEVAVEANLTRADRLRQSVLSQAFSGRLHS